jgi:hypothetical protein
VERRRSATNSIGHVERLAVEVGLDEEADLEVLR